MKNTSIAGFAAANIIHRNTSHSEYEILLQRVEKALETYSNVHRGSGHFSAASTALYEQARRIVAKEMKVDPESHTVIFCSPFGAQLLKQTTGINCAVLSAKDYGLSLGIQAVAVRNKLLSKEAPVLKGGSTARMVSRKVVIWADSPQKYEYGTPAVVNAIAFALAIRGSKSNQLIPGDFGNAHLPVKDILYKDELYAFSGLKLLSLLQKEILGKGFPVLTLEGYQPYINFDNAASTPALKPVWKAVKEAWKLPASEHRYLVSEVRNIVADFLNAPVSKYRIVFALNTTESINAAIRLIQNERESNKEFTVLNTLLEHNSNDLPWRNLPGISLMRMNNDREGFINLHELEEILIKHNVEKHKDCTPVKIVTITGSSNVLGSYNNLAQISAIVHRYGARILVDGAQLAGHKKTDIEGWDIDYFAFSGHKLYAPFGSGALVVKKDLMQEHDETLQMILASGEENIGGIAAIGKAMLLLRQVGMEVIEENERILTGSFLQMLARHTALEVHGIKADSERFTEKGGIIAFQFKKIMHDAVSRELAGRGGIGVRFGCFCSHLVVKDQLGISPALEILQNAMLTLFPKISNIIPGLMRASFGLQNDTLEIERFNETIKNITTEKSRISKDKARINQMMDAFCKERIEKVFGE